MPKKTKNHEFLEEDFLNTKKDLALFFENYHGEQAQALLARLDADVTLSVARAGRSGNAIDFIVNGNGLFFRRRPRNSDTNDLAASTKKTLRMKPCSLDKLARHLLVCDYDAEDFLMKLKVILWNIFAMSRLH
jgi:hypothetical protein